MTRYVHSFACFISLLICPEAWATGISLQEAFGAALKHSEIVSIEESKLSQSQEKLRQAKGALFPTLSAVGSYTRQDSPSDVSASSVSRLGQPEQIAARITLVQPLFRGFREFAVWRAAEQAVAASESNIAHLKILLFVTVAQNYYRLLSKEREAESLSLLLSLSDDRIRHLSARTRIGRSRKAELLTAQSQAAFLKSQRIQIEGEISRERTEWVRLTSLSRDAILEPTLAKIPMPILEFSYFLAALSSHPEMKSAVARLAVSEAEVSAARGAHYPSLDLTGNYYLKRSGILENSKWDVGLLVTIPLFQGGIISSSVREAVEGERQAQLQLSEIKKKAEGELRQVYDALVSKMEELKYLKEAAQLAQQNYEEQRRDYGHGLATNLDVISAMNSLQEYRSNLDRAECDLQMAWVELNASIGKML